MSIRNKIFIVLLLTTVLPLALVAMAVFPFHRATLIDREAELLRAVTQNRVVRVAASLQGGEETLQEIGDQVPTLGETAEVLIFSQEPSGRLDIAITPRFVPDGAASYGAMQPLLAAASRDDEPHQSVLADQRGVRTLMVARRVGAGHVVLAKKDLAEILRPDDVLRDYFLVISFIAVALGALLGLMLARSTTASLLTLTRSVSSFASAAPERIEVIGNDEVSALARSFRELWERLKAYNEELEKAVWKRTSQLTEARDALEKSNAELGARLSEIEKLYAMVVGRDLSPSEVRAEIEKLRKGGKNGEEA